MHSQVVSYYATGRRPSNAQKSSIPHIEAMHHQRLAFRACRGRYPGRYLHAQVFVQGHKRQRSRGAFDDVSTGQQRSPETKTTRGQRFESFTQISALGRLKSAGKFTESDDRGIVAHCRSENTISLASIEGFKDDI